MPRAYALRAWETSRSPPPNVLPGACGGCPSRGKRCSAAGWRERSARSSSGSGRPAGTSRRMSTSARSSSSTASRSGTTSGTRAATPSSATASSTTRSRRCSGSGCSRGPSAGVRYSILYSPLAALLGVWLLAVLTVALSAGAFGLILEREWGNAARWAGRSFALVWPGVILAGEFPFALGAALALLSLVALQSGRRWTGAAFIVLTLAASPVAFVLLAVVLIGIVATRPYGLRGKAVPALAVLLTAAAQVLVMHLFPSGTLEFPGVEALEATAFCVGLLALVWRLERAQPLRGILIVYLLAVVAVYAIPSGLGHYIGRLRQLALPLALLVAALRRWRPLPLALAAVV